MSQSTLLNPQFTDDILAAWQADESHPGRERTRRALPPRDAIQKFIDVAFLSTLRDEEGRQIRFSVALILEADVAELIGQTTRTLALPPIQLAAAPGFSEATLVKLAAAFDPKLTTIIVRWDENKGFSYWGITFHAATEFYGLTGVSVQVEGSASSHPDYFTAIATGRGKVTIARGDSQIGTLHAGYFVAASPTPFTSSSLGQHLHNAIQADPLFATYGNQYWLYARNALRLLLSEALMRGHGGTIVLLPSYVSPADGMYESTYALPGSFGVRQTLQRVIENGRSTHPLSIASGIGYGKVAYETVQRIAQLSAVDGALIMTFGFEVVAFGARLTAPPSDLAPITGPDGWGGIKNTTFEVDRYGTRHRSAFDYVAAQIGAVAFVISQDGPVRAFRRESDTTVHVWPDCTTSMFV